MAICSAIHKYGIDKFSFYILEIIEKPNKELDLLSYKELLPLLLTIAMAIAIAIVLIFTFAFFILI